VKRTLAVSTVIANMMMITITLGLAAILIAWTGSTYGLFASGAQIFYQQRGQAMQERFVVENVFSNTTASPKQVLVFVRNVGAEQINVVAIYVNGICVPSTGLVGTNQENCSGSSDPNCISPTDCIPVGSVGEYILNLTVFGTLTTGSILYIVVASARGNRATYTVRLYVSGT
jgi:archaellum component FlaF (FlaF/FlaG flagellin family)